MPTSRQTTARVEAEKMTTGLAPIGPMGPFCYPIPRWGRFTQVDRVGRRAGQEKAPLLDDVVARV